MEKIERIIGGVKHCVQIDSGKIASYTIDGFEFIHQRAKFYIFSGIIF